MKFARLTLIRLAAIWIAFGASPASAQIDNRFALGADFKIRTSDRASTEDYAEGQLGPGLLWRFGTPKPGWGFHWGLNWYAVNTERPIGGLATELGELHVRPFMAGWGYTHILGHTAITADVLGGYAIGSIGLAPAAIDAYQRRMGAQAITAKASNTLVLKPEIGVWHDVNRKIGLNVNVGYMIARPNVTVNSTLGTDKRTTRADQFILKFGVVYAIF